MPWWGSPGVTIFRGAVKHHCQPLLNTHPSLRESQKKSFDGCYDAQAFKMARRSHGSRVALGENQLRPNEFVDALTGVFNTA